MAKSHHVVPNKSGGWDVKVSGGERAIKHTETKQPAVDVARGISRNQKTECQRQCNRDQQCQSNIDQGLELVPVGASCG